MNVSHKMPDRIWVGMGSKGYWQPIVYPDPPLFCSSCNRLGHLPPKCNKTAGKLKQQPNGSGLNQAENAPAHKSGVNSEGKAPGQMDKQVWRPVLNKVQSSEAIVLPPSDAKGTNSHGEQTGFLSCSNVTEPLVHANPTQHSTSSSVDDSIVCPGAQNAQVPVNNVAQCEAQPVFDEMPLQEPEQAHVIVVALNAQPFATDLTPREAHMTATSEGDYDHVCSAMGPIGSPAVGAIPHETQPQHTAEPSTSACASSANQPLGEAETSATSPVVSAKSEGDGNMSKLHTSQALNSTAPAWSPATSSLLDDPKKFTTFLEIAAAKATPSSIEVKRSAPFVTPPPRNGSLAVHDSAPDVLRQCTPQKDKERRHPHDGK